MPSEPTFYSTCTAFSLVLILQITHFWWTNKRDKSIAWWTVAGWAFLLTDAIFAVRTRGSVTFLRVIPTSLVTLSYGLLLCAAQRTAFRAPWIRTVLVATLVDAAVLYALDQNGQFYDARVIVDRVLWASLCLAAGIILRRGPGYYWKGINTPATILIAQGIFFALRLLAGVLIVVVGRHQSDYPLVFWGDMDVMVFNSALFIAILLALLHQRQAELDNARVEMETLSGLIPVCAWCKKVRDDEGYWSEVTEYFARKNRTKVTHGICNACVERMSPGAVPPPAVD